MRGHSYKNEPEGVHRHTDTSHTQGQTRENKRTLGRQKYKNEPGEKTQQPITQAQSLSAFIISTYFSVNYIFNANNFVLILTKTVFLNLKNNERILHVASIQGVYFFYRRQKISKLTGFI